MPIWLHLVLRIVCLVVCLFSGAIVGWFACVLMIMAVQTCGVGDKATAILSLVVGGPLFVAGGYLGSVGGIMAFDRIPARCPECKAVTCRIHSDYTFRRGRLIAYYCHACGHVHQTGLREGGGRLG
jgi:hypothetical protein